MSESNSEFLLAFNKLSTEAQAAFESLKSSDNQHDCILNGIKQLKQDLLSEENGKQAGSKDSPYQDYSDYKDYKDYADHSYSNSI